MDATPRRTQSLTAPKILIACILVGACFPSVFALNPSLDVSQYSHTAWKIRDGFIDSRINAIAQTPDGYLWLGTELGLFRFDGVKKIQFQPPADQQLPSSTIFELLATNDGMLWIGTDRGLASWNGRKLTQYPELAGQFVFAMVQDHEGDVWVGTFSIPAGKLCSIHLGKVQCYEEDSLGRGVLSLYEDRKGNLWVGGQNGIWRWKPGPTQFISLPEEVQKDGFNEDVDGTLLISLHRHGLQRLVDGKLESYALPSSAPQLRVGTVLRDRDGSLWCGTPNVGVMHIHQGRVDLFSASDGLSGDDVQAIFEDREGDIWIATSDGLDRFRELAVPTFSVKQGLSEAALSVLAVKDGSVLLANGMGLHRWSAGQSGIVRDAGAQKQPARTNPHSLFQDSRGRIWAVTLDQFGYLENNRFVALTGIPGGSTRSISEDNEGDLWIADQNLGLLHVRGDKLAQQLSWAKLGYKDFAAALTFDHLQRGLWLGFFQGGLALFRDGQIQSSFGVANGLGQGRVTDIRVDQDGVVWAATAGGLSRLKNGRVATLTTKNGLPCDTVHWSIEDDEHAFWLYTSCGIVRITRSELAAWIAAIDKDREAKQNVAFTRFDISDGVRSEAYAVGFTPKVAKASDGRIWFTSLDGVSVIDPHHLPFNKLPPPVHVERIIGDRNEYSVTTDHRLRLPALTRDLQIDFTGLSLAAPEKVLFRYKLEGYDSDWQEAGNRRQAFYTNLPPRDYRFRVMASNNSGVWNEAGTFLDFSIAPAYYQTTWFRLLSLAVLFALVTAAYRMRLRYATQQVTGQMEARIHERERIARDLHDTLLQSVQGLILKFHAVSRQIPRSETAAHEALEKALDRADEVLAEGRDRVRNLREPKIPFGGLPAAFQRVAEETPKGREASFKTVVEGRVRRLHRMVQEETFSIGREALVNALSHSQGLHVELEITYDARQFRLRVRDDGKGFDPKVLEAGGRPNHWGLQGMRERSERIGGQLRIWSRPQTGTEVELTVPGATAYQVDRNKAKRFWWWRSSNSDGDHA